MSWTFPLAATDFFEALKIHSFIVRGNWGQESSGLGSGKTIVKDLRPQLFTGEAETIEMVASEFNDLETWVEVLGEGIGSFLAYDTRKQYPKSDPDGSLLSGSTPVIAARSGNFGLQLSGLPAGYVLSFSDLLGVHDGTSQLLFRITETVEADGDGLTPVFDVKPKLTVATTADLAVTLVQPPVEMQIVPGSYKLRKGKTNVTRVATFQTIQVYN